MKILLFGVSNVGKTTIGKLLAEELCFEFYDLDAEVKMRTGMTIEEFVRSGTLEERDRKRGEIIKDIIERDGNLVFSVTPISFTDSFRKELANRKDLILIELYDSAYHIFQRLFFSDENDNIYFDDKYKNEHRTYYIRAINEDLKYYGKIFSSLGTRRFNINNDSPERSVQRLIEEFALKS